MKRNIFNIWLLILIAIALSVGSVSSQSYKYGNVAFGGGGFVSAVITCPTEQNLIYARTDVGGAYRWVESTKSWTPLTDWVSDEQTGFLGVEALAIDESTPSKLYMLVGISYFNSGKTAILRSSDYGATFEYKEVTSSFWAHGNGMGRQNGERLAVDPNKGSILFCGTRGSGLFKSTDSGVNWSKVSSLSVSTTANENGICLVLFDKSSGSTGNATQRIFVGVSRLNQTNLYVSNDGGSSWSAVSGAVTNYMPQRGVISNGVLYLTYGNGSGPYGHWSASGESLDAGAVKKMTISNSQWTDITPNVNGFTGAFSGISVDKNNTSKIIVTSINRYYSQPWGWGDRIFISTNSGSNWTDPFGSSGVTMNNNGIPWIDNHALHWAGCVQIDPYNSNRVFFTSGNGIFMTENVSSNPFTLKFMTIGLEETVPLDIVPTKSGPLVSGIGDYDGCTQTDHTKYVNIHNPVIGNNSGIAVASNKTTFVVRAGGKDDQSVVPLYYSNNSGTSWTAISSTKSMGYQGRVCTNSDGSVILWCPNGSSTTHKSTNNGSSWSTVSGLSIQNAIPVAD